MSAERGFGNLQPSIWKYEYIQSLRSEYKEESYIKQREVLKEEVRMMLCNVENYVHQLELIDVLQRLGVAYHFKDEIMRILDNIFNMEIFKPKKILYATALEFRLLRQHGYDISADVFDFFLEETKDFKEHQSSIGIEGILSLYEASFHLVEEETILEDGKKYCSKILKEYVKKNDGSYTSLLINHSLKYPLHWRVPRWDILEG
ncbi:hypothetical protein PIB30_061981 [Stylosanthes scabra]|uniref:Terpene synthase N-terminal domain-containing protein n=1 Tax=Stylosanthes scabra TaxID=79078 RepID=A0ABU6TKS0_9FABA|nr:hypothetical protein [Stylosanthes scabra]